MPASTTTPQAGGAFVPALDVQLTGNLDVLDNISSDDSITVYGLPAAGVLSGIGYSSGAGATVTQLTSKSTGVTLNNLTGQITMNAANLAATTSAQFVLTNSGIAVTDVVIVNLKSGNTAGSYFVSVDGVAAGSCTISLRNYSGGGLAEAVVLAFAVIKGAIT
jgi:hypothetical protein